MQTVKNSLLLLILIFIFQACINRDSNLPFGREYNSQRIKLNAPIIEQNMKPVYSTFWAIEDYETKTGAFHASKAVYPLDRYNGKDNWHETDVYRKHLNDTTYLQVLLHPYYVDDTIKWDVTQAMYLVVDKRSLKEKNSKSYKYPDYEKMRRYLSIEQVDSVLKVWGLTRKQQTAPNNG